MAMRTMLSFFALLLTTACTGPGSERLVDYEVESVRLQLATDGSPWIHAWFRSANPDCPGLDPAPAAELDGRILSVVHHAEGGIRTALTREEIPLQNNCDDASIIYALDGASGRALRLDGDTVVMEFEQPLGARSLTLDPPEDGKIGPDDELTVHFSHADVVSASVTMIPFDVEPGTPLGPDFTQVLAVADTSASFRIPSDVPAGRLELRFDASFGAPATRCDGAASCSFDGSALMTETLERR